MPPFSPEPRGSGPADWQTAIGRPETGSDPGKRGRLPDPSAPARYLRAACRVAAFETQEAPLARAFRPGLLRDERCGAVLYQICVVSNHDAPHPPSPARFAPASRHARGRAGARGSAAFISLTRARAGRPAGLRARVRVACSWRIVTATATDAQALSGRGHPSRGTGDDDRHGRSRDGAIGRVSADRVRPGGQIAARRAPRSPARSSGARFASWARAPVAAVGPVCRRGGAQQPPADRTQS